MIKVLMYHSIVEKKPSSKSQKLFSVHESDFRRHLELLDKWGFTAITFKDYLLICEGKLNSPKRPIILTFDDGSLDNYQIAFPLLKEFGMKAVFFVLADKTIKSNTWEIGNGNPTTKLMDPYQILELHTAGFEIGSHSLTHPQLTKVSHTAAYHEISRSRMLLEILINAPVLSFAYPYGLLNNTIKQIVVDTGYSIGCAVYTGSASFGFDLFEIRRIPIPGTLSKLGFSARVLTPYEYVCWMSWKTKQVLVRNKEKIMPTIRNITSAK
jgi:peptidoglycan/xylan/chitin deacetylase (PgdA/CDA1 family)